MFTSLQVAQETRPCSLELEIDNTFKTSMWSLISQSIQYSNCLGKKTHQKLKYVFLIYPNKLAAR